MNTRTVVMTVLMTLIGLSAWGPSALADSIGIGDTIKLEWVPSVGTNPQSGGPFLLTDITTGDSFVSFCLERNEYLSIGALMQVDSISKEAVMGGVSGGNPDPLSNETAWLYRHFREGDLWSIAGIANTSANLFLLQDAIWILENEKSDSGNLFISYLLAKNPASAADLAFVSVVNPVICNDAGAIAGYKQSQLTYTHVPEPSALLLLGTGIVAAGLAGWRKRK